MIWYFFPFKNQNSFRCLTRCWTCSLMPWFFVQFFLLFFFFLFFSHFLFSFFYYLNIFYFLRHGSFILLKHPNIPNRPPPPPPHSPACPSPVRPLYTPALHPNGPSSVCHLAANNLTNHRLPLSTNNLLLSLFFFFSLSLSLYLSLSLQSFPSFQPQQQTKQMLNYVITSN